MSSVAFGLATGIRDGAYGGTAGNLAATLVLEQTGAYTITDFAVTNPDATHVAYVQIFDYAATASVTLGTTAPTYTIMVPAATTVLITGAAWAIANGIILAGTTTATGLTAATTPLIAGYAIL